MPAAAAHSEELTTDLESSTKALQLSYQSLLDLQSWQNFTQLSKQTITHKNLCDHSFHTAGGKCEEIIVWPSARKIYNWVSSTTTDNIKIKDVFQKTEEKHKVKKVKEKVAFLWD